MSSWHSCTAFLRKSLGITSWRAFLSFFAGFTHCYSIPFHNTKWLHCVHGLHDLDITWISFYNSCTADGIWNDGLYALSLNGAVMVLQRILAIVFTSLLFVPDLQLRTTLQFANPVTKQWPLVFNYAVISIYVNGLLLI